MATRPLLSSWQKYFRFGGFLLLVILVVPVLGALLMKSLQLTQERGGGSMSTMSSTGDYAHDMPEDKMWRTKGQEQLFMGNAGTDSMMAMPPMGEIAPTSLPLERKIAKQATLDLRAESLSWTRGKIEGIVKNVGGYVESVQITEPNAGVSTGWMTVRVPADRLDVALEDIKKTASAVMSENLSSSDVTDQDIDLSARLRAKQAEESALVALLNRAEKVSDVIEITSRLTLVRSEIERMEAEKRLLQNQVAMSSIALSITEDPRAVASTDSVRDGNVLKQAIAELYRFGIALGSGLVMLVVSGLPVILTYGLMLWGLYRLGKFVANRVIR